jgi:Tol biopolymer transport system component
VNARSVLPVGLLCALIASISGCGPEVPLSAPQWSPRGDRAAFVHYSPERGNLYLVDPSSPALPRLVEKNVERFAFSADGGKLYYLRLPPDGGKRGGALVCLDVYSAEVEKDIPKVVLLAEKGASLKNLTVSAAGKIYLEKQTKDDARSLLECDPGEGKVRDLTPKAGNWQLLSGRAGGRAEVLLTAAGEAEVKCSRRLLPDGRTVAIAAVKGAYSELTFLARGPAGGKYLAAGKDKRGRHLFLLESGGAGGKVRRFLLTGPGEDKPVLLAAFSRNGKKVLYSVAVEHEDARDDEDVGSESWELDLASGRTTKLAEARGRLVGAGVHSAGAGRRLEFTPGGLALYGVGEKLPGRVWPLSPGELREATRTFLAAGDSEKALTLVSGALEKAGPLVDRSRLYVLKADVLTAAGKKTDAANAYLESLLRYPIGGATRKERRVTKRLAAWSRAQPDNRILSLVVQAYRRRASGDLASAARSFREAASYSSDRAWAAGLQFWYAMNLLEAGKGAAAGPIFRKVSEVREFPQADWAAGMCVVAYAMGGRDDMAAEELLRCRDLYAKSFLAGEFRALATDLKEAKRRSRLVENVTGPRGAAARLEAWPTTGLHLSFKPSAAVGRKGKRRLGLVSYDLYRLVLVPKSGAQKALLDRVPVRLSTVSFSPGGTRIGFLAGREGGRSLYSIDLLGRGRSGNLKALLKGDLDPGTKAERYEWDAARNLPRPVVQSD